MENAQAFKGLLSWEQDMNSVLHYSLDNAASQYSRKHVPVNRMKQVAKLGIEAVRLHVHDRVASHRNASYERYNQTSVVPCTKTSPLDQEKSVHRCHDGL